MSHTFFQKQVVTLVYSKGYKCFYTGAQDLKCQSARNHLQDDRDMFGYTGNILVDKTFMDFAESVCTEYELHSALNFTVH